MDLKILFFGCYFWSIANNQIIGPPGRKQQYSTAADYEVRNRVVVFFVLLLLLVKISPPIWLP